MSRYPHGGTKGDAIISGSIHWSPVLFLGSKGIASTSPAPSKTTSHKYHVYSAYNPLITPKCHPYVRWSQLYLFRVLRLPRGPQLLGEFTWQNITSAEVIHAGCILASHWFSYVQLNLYQVPKFQSRHPTKCQIAHGQNPRSRTQRRSNRRPGQWRLHRPEPAPQKGGRPNLRPPEEWKGAQARLVQFTVYNIFKRLMLCAATSIH